MVDVYCKLYNLKPIKITYNKELILNYKKLLENISKKISLIILANPNSPTGTIIDHEQMIKILKKQKTKNTLIIDEAYEGFF